MSVARARMDKNDDEEEDSDANWMNLIRNDKDREKIIRLQKADDPSLRAMFKAISISMKKKDENMERAVAIGFERGVSFASGKKNVGDSSSGASGARGAAAAEQKPKKTKRSTAKILISKGDGNEGEEEFAASEEEDSDSDFDDDSSDDDEEEGEDDMNRTKIERRSKASSAPGTLLVSDEEEEDFVVEKDRIGRDDSSNPRKENNGRAKEDDTTALRWVVERSSSFPSENDETQKSVSNDLEVIDLRRKLANAEVRTNNAILSRMLNAWRLACFTSRRNESVVQRMLVASEHRRMRAAFRSWMDATLEFKRRRMLVGVGDADGGDRKKKKNRRSDLSGTTGTVDEEEEFAPDYSEECERLQLEVKSLREILERERTKPLSGPGAEFREQANAFNAHLKKVVRDLEATRSLNAQLTRRLEMKEKQLHGYRGGGNEYADDAMKSTNRANQRTMGTQTTFETYPGSHNNSKYSKVVTFKNEREQSFVKDSAPGNRYEHVKAENEKLRQELEKQTKILHEKFEMQLRAAEAAERKLNEERQKRAREIEFREKASNDLKREHEREMKEMIESYDALYGSLSKKNNNNSSNSKVNDSSFDTNNVNKPSPPRKMSATSSVMKKRRDEIVSNLRSPRDFRVREDTYRNNEYKQHQQQQKNSSDNISSILNPRERSSPLSPEKDDAMTFEKMASIREDYIKQPHHRTTGHPQREKTSPPPNNFAMLRPPSMNTLDSYGEEGRRNRNRNTDEYEDAGDLFLSPTKTFSESENHSFRDAASALETPASSAAARNTVKGYFKRGEPNGSNSNPPRPAANSSPPQNKVTPKGFTPRGEELTLSAFNEYAKAGKKQSRTMGTSTRDDQFDDIDGSDFVGNDAENKKMSQGRDLASSLPSRLFSASANEMNKSASEDDYDDDYEEEEEEEEAGGEDGDDDDWGLTLPLPKKPHHLTTAGGKSNAAITKEELELSRSDWDDLLSSKNSHRKGEEDGSGAARKGARRNLRFSESQHQQEQNAPASAKTQKTKTMVVAELVVRGWSKSEALFALEKVGENDVKKCAEWLIRRNH